MSNLAQGKSPFNSPLESGVRSLIILLNTYPNPADIQLLVELDYFVLHTADIGGPNSLHAALPYRSGELLVRRGIIERGLMLFMSRGLIERVISSDGIGYIASDSASPFIGSLRSKYIEKLKNNAQWVVNRFSNEFYGNNSLKTRENKLWREQFQPTERFNKEPS